MCACVSVYIHTHMHVYVYMYYNRRGLLVQQHVAYVGGEGGLFSHYHLPVRLLRTPF